MRGNAWEEMGQHDKAIADFTEAIKLNPRKALNFYLRAHAWLEKSEFNKAIADFTEAIKLDPREARFRTRRAFAWSEHGDHAEAIADYDEAIRLDPQNPGLFTWRGIGWTMAQQPENALADFHRALELDPKEPFAYLGRGCAWELTMQYDKVASNFNEMVRVLPDDPRGHQELAWTLATCPVAAIRDGKRAVAESTVACRLTHGKDPECLDTLAAASAEAGDFDAAVKWETQAIDLEKARNLRTGDTQKEFQMRDRLSLYKKRQPYHEIPDGVVRIRRPDL